MDREQFYHTITIFYTSLNNLGSSNRVGTRPPNCIEWQLYNILVQNPHNAAYGTVQPPKEISVWDPQDCHRREIYLMAKQSFLINPKTMTYIHIYYESSCTGVSNREELPPFLAITEKNYLLTFVFNGFVQGC